MLSTAILLLIANNGKVLNMVTSHMLALPPATPELSAEV